MAYTPTEWKNGDVITAEKLNKIESELETLSEASGYSGLNYVDVDIDLDTGNAYLVFYKNGERHDASDSGMTYAEAKEFFFGGHCTYTTAIGVESFDDDQKQICFISIDQDSYYIDFSN